MAIPNDGPARVAIVIVGAVITSLIVALVLAPLVTVSWCSDAPAGGTSVCGSESRSVLGAAASRWLWGAAQTTVIVGAVAIARRRAASAP